MLRNLSKYKQIAITTGSTISGGVYGIVAGSIFYGFGGTGHCPAPSCVSQYNCTGSPHTVAEFGDCEYQIEGPCLNTDAIRSCSAGNYFDFLQWGVIVCASIGFINGLCINHCKGRKSENQQENKESKATPPIGENNIELNKNNLSPTPAEQKIDILPPRPHVEEEKTKLATSPLALFSTNIKNPYRNDHESNACHLGIFNLPANDASGMNSVLTKTVAPEHTTNVISSTQSSNNSSLSVAPTRI